MPKYLVTLAQNVTKLYKFEVEANSNHEAWELGTERLLDECETPIEWGNIVHSEYWVQDSKRLTNE